MRFTDFTKATLTILFTLVISACGGGGDPTPEDISEQPTFNITDATVIEGDDGITQAQLTVILSPYLEAASVQYSTQDGTATSGSDYTTTSGTLSFVGGNTRQVITIDIHGDITIEPDETITVALTEPTNGLLKQATATLTITNNDIPSRPLNDTGQTFGGSHPMGNDSACTSNDTIDAPQDCDQGRDATHNDDSDGHAGFSFTKLDSTGDTLSASASQWPCVKDNVTGLIWEVKTDDDGLHDKDDQYNWYNTDPATNGGAVGADDDGDICYDYNISNSSSYCNTQAFTARVNQQRLCGASDWRMPTEQELRGLANFDIVKLAIDTDYFPNTVSDRYWSSSAYANNSSDAWYVNFSSGSSGTDDRGSDRRVRLVRGGQ